MKASEVRKTIEYLRDKGWTDTQIVEFLLYIAD